MKTIPSFPSGRYLLTIVILFFTFSFSVAQNLYEMSVKLNELYGQIRNDPNQNPKAFFDELEKIYNRQSDLDPSVIANDFRQNRYLTDEVNYVLRQYAKLEATVSDTLAVLEQEKQSIINQVIGLVEEACRPRRLPTGKIAPPCGIDQELVDFRLDPSLDKLLAIIKKTTNKTLKTQLQKEEEQLYTRIAEIRERQTRSQSSLQLTAGSSDGIAFTGSGNATAAIAPTISIAAPDGGSVQSKIIDGTSKWIAERMREELSIAFFDRFENWVAGKNLITLFPRTFGSLKSSATTDFNIMMQQFKAAFEKDLRQMPFNLSHFLSNELIAADTFQRIDRKSFLLQQQIRNQRSALDSVSNMQQMYDDQWFSYLRKYRRLWEEAEAYPDEEWRSNYASQYEASGERIQRNQYENREKLVPIQQRLDSLQQLFHANEKLAFDTYKKLKFVLFTIAAIEQLSEGQHPTALLTMLNHNMGELFHQPGRLHAAINVMDVISKSLISSDKDNQNVWLHREQIETLIHDNQLREFYFGLLEQTLRQRSRNDRLRIHQERDRYIQNNYQLELDSLARRMARERQQVSNLFYGLALEGEGNSTYALGTFIDKIVNESPIDGATTRIWMATTGFGNPPHEDFELLKKENGFPVPYIDKQIDHNKKVFEYLVSYFAEAKKNLQLFRQPGEDHQNHQNKYEEVHRMIDNQWSIIDSTYQLNKDLDSSEIFGDIDDILSDISSEEAKAKIRALKIEADSISGNLYESGKSIYYAVEIALQKHATLALPRTYELIARDSLNTLQKILANDPVYQQFVLEEARLDAQSDEINLLLFKSRRSFGDLLNGFVQFAEKVDYIYQDFNALRQNGQAGAGSQDFVRLLKSSLDILMQVYQIALPDEPESMAFITNLTNNLFDAYSAVLNEDYDAVVMNILPVADSLLEISYRKKGQELQAKIGNDTPQSQLIAKVLDNPDALTESEKKTLKNTHSLSNKGANQNPLRQQFNKLLEEKENKRKKLHEIFKYGAFLAAVVESETSDDVKNAIRAVALPTGSYSIKRRSHRNISLNTYPGITGGLEWATTTTATEVAPNFGFTAPIGLAVSWAYKSKVNGLKYYTDRKYRRKVDRATIFGEEEDRFFNGHSGSLYFPLIDLGAVVLFRLGDSEEALPSDITFQQIFSPGMMYAHGLPNLPVSIMGGFQISPQLRKINEQKANAFRLNLSIVVDLPLANLHTRTRKLRD